MKTLKYTFLFLVGALASCSSDDSSTVSELDGLNKIQEFLDKGLLVKVGG